MEVCRLCLDLLQESSSLKLDDHYKCIVTNVVPEMDLDITSGAVICNQCSSYVHELHAFKISCFENQQLLKQKLEGQNESTLTVKEILHGSEMSEVAITDKAKERTCRMCLESIDCESFTILKPSNPDAYLESMLTMCLPEMDLQISRDPVMCEKCWTCLQTFHHFKSACFDVEEKLKNYKTAYNIHLDIPISLHTVLETLQDKNKQEFVCATDIKSEELEDSIMDDDNELKDSNIAQEQLDIKIEE